MKVLKSRNISIILLLAILSLGACQKHDLASLQEVIHVERNGAIMPAYIHGNAESKKFIVILHGGPGGFGYEYRSGIFKERLEKDYAIVYFDQRGQGMADGRFPREDLNLEEMAKDVIALGEVLHEVYGDDNTYVLLGHSWGGTLGTAALLEDDADRLFQGWIEVSGAHDIPLLLKEEVSMYLQVADTQLALNNNTEFWQGVKDNVGAYDINNITDEQSGYMNSTGFEAEGKLQEDGFINKASGEGFLWIFAQHNFLSSYMNGSFTSGYLQDAGIEETALTGRLSEITMPSLLLWGRYDFVVPPALGVSAFNNLGSSQKEYVEFEMSGHSCFANEPDKFYTEVKDFVDAL